MSDYKTLKKRLDQGDVIIHDGAVGTHLQHLGVPIAMTSWAGAALHTHPDTVLHMHEQYVKAGVDILTTNTYSAARHCFEPMGLGDSTRELNMRAVHLAQTARDKHGKARPIYIGGAVSNYGIVAGSERNERTEGPGRSPRDIWPSYTAEQAQENLHNQARYLAEAGVDFLLAESTGSILNRKWVTEACLATGLPVWVGYKTRLDGKTVKSGYLENANFSKALDEIIPLGGDVINVFHSPVEATTASIPIVKKKWKGAIGVYPDASRHDYVSPREDSSFRNPTSVKQFVKQAQDWVKSGVQIVGTCCGFGPEYIEPLRKALPARIPGRK
ncbi:MAG: homocysteine S-methyltransferase family protein [Alphaproteobacteria bacterium]